MFEPELTGDDDGRHLSKGGGCRVVAACSVTRELSCKALRSRVKFQIKRFHWDIKMREKEIEKTQLLHDVTLHRVMELDNVAQRARRIARSFFHKIFHKINNQSSVCFY